MGMKPIRLGLEARQRFRNRLAGLDDYQLSVLISMLHLVHDDFDLSDLNGLPAMLDWVLDESVCGESEEEMDDLDEEAPLDEIEEQFLEELRRMNREIDAEGDWQYPRIAPSHAEGEPEERPTTKKE